MIKSNQTPGAFVYKDIYDSLDFVAKETNALPVGLTIDKVSDTWEDQQRLPLVNVTRHYDNASVTFTQVYIVQYYQDFH